MPRGGGRPGVAFRHKQKNEAAAKPKNNDRDIYDDPETNGKAFYELPDFRVFLTRVSKQIVKDPRGYGRIKAGLGRVIGVPWPHEQWFAAALTLLEDSHSVEYLNKKFNLRLKVIYRRQGYCDKFTIVAPPVKHTKYLRRSPVGTLEFA